MKQARKTLPELIEAIGGELARLNYRERYIRTYRAIWDKLLAYANSKGENHFTEELGISFLSEYYNYPYEHTTRLPNMLEIKARAIRILGDYQLHGYVLRKNRKSIPVISDGFKAAIDGFMEYSHRRNHRESTIKRNLNDLFDFIEYLHTQKIENASEISSQHISGFVSSLAGYRKGTIRNVLYALRCFFRVMHQQGIHSQDLSTTVPKLRFPRQDRVPTIWTGEELDRILESVDRGNPCGKRDYAVLLLAAQLGLRESDVSNLKLDNIKWETSRIEFVQSKTSEGISLPLLQDLGLAIIDYLKYGRPTIDSPYVFVKHVEPYDKLHRCNNILQRYRRLAGIKVDKERPHGLHTLRHTLASRLLAQHIPLEVISGILGHASPNSSKTYLHVDIENLRKCALSPEEVTDDE